MSARPVDVPCSSRSPTASTHGTQNHCTVRPRHGTQDQKYTAFAYDTARIEPSIGFVVCLKSARMPCETSPPTRHAMSPHGAYCTIEIGTMIKKMPPYASSR